MSRPPDGWGLTQVLRIPALRNANHTFHSQAFGSDRCVATCVARFVVQVGGKGSSCSKEHAVHSRPLC